MQQNKQCHLEALEQIKKYKSKIKSLEKKIKLLEKNDFKDTIKKAGYTYIDNKDIQGIGKANQRKPDYIAYLDSELIIGEFKSTYEPPTTSSWRNACIGDSKSFKNIRSKVKKWEAGCLDKRVGGHIIIIEGQLPDYKEHRNITYKLPAARQSVRFAYSVLKEQQANAEQAIKEIKSRLGKKYSYEIFPGEITVTFCFTESAV